MDKHTQAVSKESVWRNRLERHASSGKSVSAFCRDEALSEGNFYAWRSRLQPQTLNTPSLNTPSRPKKTEDAFIDLGVVKGVVAANRLAGVAAVTPVPGSSIAVHIDLGGGVSLTITKH